MDYPRGSEWRKWDLHVHTTSSYDKKYNGTDADDLLVAEWIKHEFVAVAITDHFKIDKDHIETLRAKVNATGKTITVFPGVELRTDKGGANIHVILIFSELCNLKILSDDFDAIMFRQKAKDKDDDAKIRWDYEDIKDFAESHDAVISLHAGSKTSGVDDVITNALEVAQAIKEEYSLSAHIYEIGKVRDVEDYKTMVFPSIKSEKPLILCSDNHDPRTYAIKAYCWIKADPTFSGLKQVINHPSERVFVGDIPSKKDQAQKNPEKYIKSFSVRKSENAKNSDTWFDFDLPLSIGLVAVIGNKGSGKSAFSDIISNICSSRNVDKSSFLSEMRFRKKPAKLAADYQGKIIWENGIEIILESLQENSSGVELVKYLPQSYIEKVCNELDNSFQTEIDKVIFSYIDESERGAASTLDELIKSKTSAIGDEIVRLTETLNAINDEIITQEKKNTPSYLTDLQGKLEKLEQDYHILFNAPPVKVEKPTEGLDEEKDTVIQQTVTFIEKLRAERKIKRNELNALSAEISEIASVIQAIKEIQLLVVGVQERVETLSITNSSLINWKLNLTADIQTLENLHNQKITEQKALTTLTSEFTGELPIINHADSVNFYETLLQENFTYDYKIKLTEAYKALLTEATTLAQRQYQKYLDDKKEWERKKSLLQGDAETQNTIIFLKEEIKYVTRQLAGILDSKRSDRLRLIGQVYDCIQRKVGVYNEIYQPIKQKIGKLLQNIDDEVSFTAGISPVKDFGTEILQKINRKIKSELYGADGDQKLSDLLKSTDYSARESVIDLVKQIFDFISVNTDIEKITRVDRKDFFDYISGLNYLNVDFNLTMGGSSLDEMSPGQRGTVLLVFYLALDKGDIPLIIDQPEDNLDNQSVFNKLVPCITNAKKIRQIIIVTHNPNIAIACDAEQIISCSIDKHTHKISYHSGAIEETTMKDDVVKILEGTQPAFDLRNKKYSYYGDTAVTT